MQCLDKAFLTSELLDDALRAHHHVRVCVRVSLVEGDDGAKVLAAVCVGSMYSSLIRLFLVSAFGVNVSIFAKTHV